MSMASVNGAVLQGPGEMPAPAELRQRACTELLRQAAQRAGLLDAADAPSADGVISEAAANAIDALLAQALQLPEPSEAACRRHMPRTRAPTARANACERATSCLR